LLKSKYTDTNISATQTLPDQFLVQQHLRPIRQERRVKDDNFQVHRGQRFEGKTELVD
jgi:hypothetical protein